MAAPWSNVQASRDSKLFRENKPRFQSPLHFSPLLTPSFHAWFRPTWTEAWKKEEEEEEKRREKEGIEGKGSRFWERNAREDWEGSRGGIRWRGEAGALLRVYMRAKLRYSSQTDKSDIGIGRDRIDKERERAEWSERQDRVDPSNSVNEFVNKCEEDSARARDKEDRAFFFFGPTDYLVFSFSSRRREWRVCSPRCSCCALWTWSWCRIRFTPDHPPCLGEFDLDLSSFISVFLSNLNRHLTNLNQKVVKIVCNIKISIFQV